MAVGSVVAILCMLPLSGFQPFFARAFPEGVWMVPFMGMLCGLIAVILLPIALRQRRPVLIPSLLLLLYGATFFYAMRGEKAEAAWVNEFHANLAPLEKAVQYAKRRPFTRGKSNDSFPLTRELGYLSMNEKFYRYRSPEGEDWYLFPQFMTGIDNGVGFAWSETGKPPPRMSFYEVVRTRPLAYGWFMFWTT